MLSTLFVLVRLRLSVGLKLILLLSGYSPYRRSTLLFESLLLERLEMKRFLLATLLLELLTSRALAEPLNWTGWYGGINAGYGWGSGTDPQTVYSDNGNNFVRFVALGGLSTPPLNTAGGFGGGQIGYNKQIASWVYGFEADIQGADIRKSFNVTRVPPTFVVAGTSTGSSSLEWFGTLRGRLGFTSNDWLFYSTGGIIFGGVKSSLALSIPAAGYAAADSTNSTKAGWVLGAGIEKGWDVWSAKLEYLYFDMGRDTLSTQGVGGFAGDFYSASVKTAGHLARVGLNRRF